MLWPRFTTDRFAQGLRRPDETHADSPVAAGARRLSGTAERPYSLTNAPGSFPILPQSCLAEWLKQPDLRMGTNPLGTSRKGRDMTIYHIHRRTRAILALAASGESVSGSLRAARKALSAAPPQSWRNLADRFGDTPGFNLETSQSLQRAPASRIPDRGCKDAVNRISGLPCNDHGIMGHA
jgi:hypothetical protein